MIDEEIKKESKAFAETLTEEELAAPSYLDWSDEKLGKQTRLTAKYLLTKKMKGFESVSAMAAIFILLSQVDSCNGGELEMQISDVTSELHPEPSNWILSVKKIS